MTPPLIHDSSLRFSKVWRKQTLFKQTTQISKVIKNLSKKVFFTVWFDYLSGLVMFSEQSIQKDFSMFKQTEVCLKQVF